ncbi:short-chain dehydrogenase/reductase SDR [Pyrobaculum islandicum DSM 4184]|uniref:Short-chain dehydrogenase/reductase SDR n=1 Tax=Pyrobaculum islandicum (strain DSM 4184 / JCM 9189 / GEO3) TaxID=384616 RepID=A1RUQ2_PYRIL|nr:SDR family NAD(P)-dependent oxidoreductase [Pyrobaculum islandicum]ABL88684.1 short-chain dehydrogenase/reductase SDR [Pyrobaculum islandicum DSM 4184]
MTKTALITGASSGIGRALAEELAARRYNLILVARRADALESLARGLTARYGVQAVYYVKDLSQLEEIDALARDVRQELYALVNNAGAGVYGPLHELDDRDIVSTIALNLIAPVLLTKKLLPRLVRGGCVVNVSSLAAYIPIPWLGIYTSTKAAIANFTDALRIELKPHGIRVIGVYPGYVQTEFHKRLKTTPSATKVNTPKGPALDPHAPFQRAAPGPLPGARGPSPPDALGGRGGGERGTAVPGRTGTADRPCPQGRGMWFINT